MQIYKNKIFDIFIKSLFIVIILLVFICYALQDSYFVRLGDSDYEVGWINMPELTDVYYSPEPDLGGVGLLGGGRVTDVYWNEKYILIKKCNHYNDSIEGFYIIEILPQHTKYPPHRKSGPYTEEEYTRIKSRLHINEKDMKYENIFKRWIWL